MEYLNLKCPKCGHEENVALNGWAKVCCVACHAVITSKQAAQQKYALDGELPCLACGGEVGHRINCPHGIAFSSPPVI